MSPIVVGVDGSEPSQRALSWALTHGRRTKVPVRVVYAWRTLPERAPDSGISDDHHADEELLRLHRAGEALVERMLVEAKEEAEGVTVEVEIVNEPAAQALISRSVAADRVVVATRGRGGFPTLLLGSVSQQLIQHAHCPVVMVPAPRKNDRRSSIAAAPVSATTSKGA